MRRGVLAALAVALALAATGCRGCGDAAQTAGPQAAENPALDRGALPDASVVSPVCGLEFSAKESVATRVHDGKTYYFLVEDHARAFEADPQAYLAAPKP